MLVGTDTGEVWRVSPAAEWTLLVSGLPGGPVGAAARLARTPLTPGPLSLPWERGF